MPLVSDTNLHAPCLPIWSSVDALSVSALVGLVTLTFDLFTLKLVRIIARGVNNLPGALKMQDKTLQDKTMTDKLAWPDFAG